MFDRLIVPRREAPTVSLTPGGHLCLNVDRGLLVRVDDVLVRDESLTIEPMSGRGPGGNESLTGLSRVTGGGALVLSRGDGSFQPLHLRDDACFLLASAVWAFEGALLWEGGVLPGTRGPVDTQRGTIPPGSRAAGCSSCAPAARACRSRSRRGRRRACARAACSAGSAA